MDCDKFDQHVLDALYDELDELTYAALKRHVEGCGRCAGVWAGLRATREVGVMPIVEAPDDLEARILDAVAVAQKKAPWPKKVLRGLAWAGSHAMRPQLAMAALFFLVIGSSLLLLRARPGTLGPVSVSERGAPMPDSQDNAAAAAAAPPPAPAEGMAAATAAAAFGEAHTSRRVPGDLDEKNAGAPGQAGGDDARAALAAARAVRDGAGCPAAIPKLEAVAVSFAGTQAAADAMWDEANCYKSMGDAQKAQQLFLALRSTHYRDRAEQQLAADGVANAQGNAVASRAPAAAAPAAAPTAVAGPAPTAVASKAGAAKADEGKAVAAEGGAENPPHAKAAPRAAGGATNPRAPAAPAKRAVDGNVGF